MPVRLLTRFALSHDDDVEDLVRLEEVPDREPQQERAGLAPDVAGRQPVNLAPRRS